MRPVRGELAHSCSLKTFRRSTAISKEAAIKSVADGDGKMDVVTDLMPAEAHAFQGGSVAAIHSQAAKAVLGNPPQAIGRSSRT